MTQKKHQVPQKPPLFVQLPDDLRTWLEKTAKDESRTLKAKTILVFEQARRLEAIKG